MDFFLSLLYNGCIMRKLVVNKINDGKKLNTFLLDNIDGLNLNLLYKTLRKKDIKVNSKRVSENVTIFENDIIEVYISDSLLSQKNTINLNIVFEDENILVINKPSGIEVNNGENSLEELLKRKYLSSSFSPKPCHRLDRNTTRACFICKK